MSSKHTTVLGFALATLVAITPLTSHAGSWRHSLARTLQVTKLRVQARVAAAVGVTAGLLEIAAGVLPMRHREGLFPMHHYQEVVSPRLTRGSRLSEAEMRALAAQGYTSIISLTAERVPNEKRLARELGLQLHKIHIIDNTAPTLKQMKRFLDIATNPASGRVYVHCEAGHGRTGTAVAVYRVAVEGMSSGRAIAEAQRHGLKMRSQKLFLREFAKQLRAGNVPGYSPRPLAAAL